MGNSLIFTAASSQYLSATGKTGINQQKFTSSFWVKNPNSGNNALIYFGDTGASNFAIIEATASSGLTLVYTVGGTIASVTTNTTILGDGNWHNCLVGVDTTQSVASNRVVMQIDTIFVPAHFPTYPALNAKIGNNYASTYTIGGSTPLGLSFFGGNLAYDYYIDGQQLSSSFFTKLVFGKLYPATYSGSYTGMFDFDLNFFNGLSTTTLGLDSSGEGNNWTLNNMTTANQSSDSPFGPTFLADRVLYIPAGINFTNSNVEPIRVGNSLAVYLGVNGLIPADQSKLELLVTKPSGQQFAVMFPFCFIGNVDIPLTLTNGFLISPVMTAGTYVVGQIFGNQLDQFGAWTFSLLSSGYPISPQVTIIVNPS